MYFPAFALAMLKANMMRVKEVDVLPRPGTPDRMHV
jgi:hypothetical protein